MANRGQLTVQIKAKALELLGKEICQRELRLMPYAQHCLVNGNNIEPNKINSEERAILSDWRARGWISGGASDFEATKEFWNVMSDLIWLGYVTHDEQPDD
jgi:hypothetical protein